MSKYYNQRLLVGNCLDTLKQLADDSIDSVVTDPPYELGFMGKSWDSTGIAFNIAVWQECMRVLKPGGHLLAFSGSRTYHRMAVAIEDAGFEIRDQIMWLYGSGFPKSMAIDKAIDKAAGAKRKVIGKGVNAPNLRDVGAKSKESIGIDKLSFGQVTNAERLTTDITEPSTKEAKQWQGWGTALKPAHEPIVVARKPISMKTVAENVLTYGTGAINIDASRVGTETITINGQGNDKMFHGNFSGQIDNPERTGRFPANLILSHNPDCQLTGTTNETYTTANGKGFLIGGIKLEDLKEAADKKLRTPNGELAETVYKRYLKSLSVEVTPPNSATSEIYNCTEGCPFLEFPNAGKGNNGKPFNYSGTEYNNKDTSLFNGDKPEAPSNYNDNGTAARFFYCAKTSKSERNTGLSKQNFHPTVKPLTLMRYLIKLVTPPNGTVLDPFLGSGSTAVAAVLDGFNWKGCEMTEDYLPIIKGRVEHAIAEVKKAKSKKESTPTLFEEDKVDLDTTHI